MSKTRNIADLGSNDVLDTNADGIDVTGTITAEGLTFSQEASGSPYPEQQIKWSNDSTTANGFYISQDSNRNGRIWHEQGLELLFGTGNTERMRIDYNGNLLVGHTDQTTWDANNGVSLTPSGGVLASRQNTVGFFNRRTTDGDIIEFRKDGTKVGSIGVANGDNLYIAADDTTDVGLKFDGDANSIYGCNASGNIRDNAITLGDPSVRFKDLYLSGGVYLGGTGSANYLDDYEEGTWTPTGPNIGIATIHSAVYTKIGQLVHLFFDITRDASPADASQASSIAGLPFSANSATNDAGSTAVVKGLFQVVYTEVSGATLAFKDYSDDVLLTRSNVANKRMRCSVTYFTDA